MTTQAKSQEIRKFIAANVGGHAHNIATIVAAEFGMSVQSARRHLAAIVKDGLLTVSGNTKAKRYSVKLIVNESQTISTQGLAEDTVWDQFISPHLAEIPDNIIQILNITSSEMLNNVIDHSESDRLLLTVVRSIAHIEITIRDFGVGIFRKLKKAFNLDDERQAILELSKGRLTTSPDQHSGYGIFFSSRMVNTFRLWSGGLFFLHEHHSDDWLIGIDSEMEGTFVQLRVELQSKASPKEVYDKFCSDPNSENDLGFHRTHVPLKLAQFGQESLVSRSQAKRVLSRFERFSEVMLDFNGIELVGQGFIDEIFRVFKKQHPTTKIVALNANPNVQRLIQLAHSIGRDSAPAETDLKP